MKITAASLRAADARASRQNDQRDPANPSSGCPEKHYVIEIKVVDEADKPVADLVAAVRNSDGMGRRNGTDINGWAKFAGLEANSYELCLLELDQTAWELIKVEPLDSDDGEVSFRVDLKKLELPQHSSAEHVIQRGECAAKLAARYGHNPKTVWDHSKNSTLREERKSLYVLHDDDRLHIPAPRLRWNAAQIKQRYYLRRLGLLETTRIQFLDHEKKARSGLEYLFHAETEDGQVLPDKTGRTDSGGFIVQPISPLTTRIDVTLKTGTDVEKYELDVGHLDEVETTRGLQARLNNLGFDCGPEDGVHRAEMEEAVRRFQTENNLPVTGDANSDVLVLLKDLHRA